MTDTALLQALIQGHDPHDATSDALERDDLLASLRAGVDGMRIGVVEELESAGCEPGVRTVFLEAVATLERMGARIERVSLPHVPF